MRKQFSIRLKFIILFVVFGISNSGFTQQYDVIWENLVKTQFTSPNLVKQTSSSGTGTASSVNLLYGYNESIKSGNSTFDGYFTYSPSNNNQNKKIGFSSFDSKGAVTNQIEYGFSFLSNGTAQAFAFDNIVTVNYSANQEFKVSRVGNLMKYFANGTLVLEVQIDKTENLLLRAELITSNSSFNNVKVSFNTKRLIVAPIINHANNTIKMDITGSFPPFEYSWDDGKKYTFPLTNNPEVKFSEGMHKVTIKDAANNVFERTFSVGTDVTWTGFLLTYQDNHTLKKTLPLLWGQANSTATIPKDDLFWMEYIATPETSNKAFGIVYTNVLFLSYSNLELGYLLSNNQLQVIYKGNIVLTTEFYDKDALVIMRDEKGISWKRNGAEIYVVKTPLTANFLIGGLLNTSTALKDLHFFNLPLAPVQSVWEESKLTGLVNVDISSIASQVGPFHYYLSKEAVKPLHDMYQFTKDSIFGGVLDSVSFYQGNATQLAAQTSEERLVSQLSLSKQHVFKGVESGQYNLSVFDKTGLLILAQAVKVLPQLAMINNDGFTKSGDIFTSTKTNASTELDFYLIESVAKTALNFNIVNTVDKYSIGFENNEDLTKTILYGFKVDQKKVNLIVNGVVQSLQYPIKQNNTLSLVKENGNLLYQINGLTKLEVSLGLSEQYSLKTVLTAVTANAVLQILPFDLFPKKYVYTATVDNATCNDAQISLKFKIAFIAKQTTPTTYHYDIYNVLDPNPNALAVYSGNANWGQEVSIPNVAMGVYRISGSSTNLFPAVTINETATVGIETQFDMLRYYNLSPNSYSLSKNLPATNINAYAISSNTLKSTLTGWVSFTPIIPTSTNSSYISFNSNFDITNPTGTYIWFYRVGNSSNIKYEIVNNGTPVQSTYNAPVGAKFVVAIDQSSMRLFMNNQLQQTLVRPGGELHATAFSRALGEGFQDMLFSFTCRDIPIVYTKLVEELSAGYYVALNSKIGIYFEEEYGIDANKTIPIKVYDKSHNLKAKVEFDGTGGTGSIGTISSLPYRENENKHILNLQNLSLNNNEFYTLEITTISGEKKYLKFLNKN